MSVMTLVLIGTQADANLEAQKMQHGIGHLFRMLCNEGALVYSLRNEKGEPLLTLSVRRDPSRSEGHFGAWYCDHVVGLANRRPTPDELVDLDTLLAMTDAGIELRYDPHTTR